MTRNGRGHSRDDVVRAAGRLFASRGYHGTSMRDLGRELGLLGSSIYSHVTGKQDLLVEVVERGATLFEASARTALARPGTSAERLGAFISGHLDVVLDHVDEARTFLNEADALEPESRTRVLAARDHYEAALRTLLEQGIADGSIRADLDPALAGIFILSVVNAVERWYRPQGRLDRPAVVDEITRFVAGGVA
jgi:AcrR family transcriptional regulator